MGALLTIKELTETGNRASKVSGFQVSDCLRWLDTVFSWSIPPNFAHKLRRHKQRLGKIATTVVLDKDENLL